MLQIYSSMVDANIDRKIKKMHYEGHHKNSFSKLGSGGQIIFYQLSKKCCQFERNWLKLRKKSK